MNILTKLYLQTNGKKPTDELKPTIEKCMAQKFNLKDLLV
jgi:hypothetical protein